MPQVELSDKFCQTARPAGPQVDYFDTVVRGLSLRVSANTRAFYLNYTTPYGKRARMKLGRYPDLSLAKAREKARDARGDLSEGTDPLIEKRALQASQTVSDIVENYLARHASTKRSADEIARRLRKNVTEVIGSVRLSELHRRDFTKCLDAVKDRGAHIEANRVFEDIRSMVRWANSRGDLDVNLAVGMRRPSQPVVRDRVLSAGEIRIMWAALPDAVMRESTRRVLRLCLITAQRVGEVSGMTRAEIDLDQKLWTIPVERSKNKRQHAVPLSGMALDIINEQITAADRLARKHKRPPSRFVFPGPGDHAALRAMTVARAVWNETTINRGHATIMGIEPWTTHDLRRSAATHMEEIGINPFTLAHLLNHATVTRATVTSRVYARYSYDKEKRQGLDLWADRLAAIIQGGADVIPLQASAR